MNGREDTAKGDGKRLRIALKSAVVCLLFVFTAFAMTPTGESFISEASTSAGLTEFFKVADGYPLNIHFIDVGCADCTLIEADGSFALIDAGTYTSSDDIIRYLEKQQVEKIDLLVASHFDSDHIGSMASVIERFEVSRLICPDVPDDVIPYTLEYQRMMDTAAQKDVEILYVTADTEPISLGGAELDFMAPVADYEDINDSSVVIKLVYWDFSALFCGDIEAEAEADIVSSGEDISAKLIKIPHHGSSTSSTRDFLEAVSADWAVVSVGENSNGLPDTKIMTRLEATVGKVYRTDVAGTVIFSVNDSGAVITAENGDEL